MRTEKYVAEDHAKKYLTNLARLEKAFGLDLRYSKIRLEDGVCIVKQPTIKSDNQPESARQRLFTDTEWDVLKSADQLRRTGSEDDYDIAVEATKGVYAGKFR